MVIDVLVVAAVLVLAGVGLAVADRALAGVAQGRAATRLAAMFGSRPAVRVHGAPFLVQALRGRYADVEVIAAGVRVGEVVGASLNARLANVYLPPRDLLRRRVSELPCERIRGRLLLPYPELARLTRVPGLTLTFDGGRLFASASLPVPGIGQLARVVGRARLTVDGGAVWLRVSRLEVAGLSVTALVIRQLLPRLNVPIPLPPLPWGLRIEELRPTADGLVVAGGASAVVLRRVTRPEQWEGRPAG